MSEGTDDRTWTLVGSRHEPAVNEVGAPWLRSGERVVVCPLERATRAERQLLECEEALRSTQEQYAAFEERMLEPIKGTEGKDIQSMSWDDLLGVAVRNLNTALDLGRERDEALDLLARGMARLPDAHDDCPDEVDCAQCRLEKAAEALLARHGRLPKETQ